MHLLIQLRNFFQTQPLFQSEGQRFCQSLPLGMGLHFFDKLIREKRGHLHTTYHTINDRILQVIRSRKSFKGR